MKENFGEMPYHKAVKVFQKVRAELSTLAVDLFEDWVRSAGYIVAESVMNQENSIEYKVNKMADPRLNIVEFWSLFPGRKEWKDFCEMYKFAKYELLYNPVPGEPSEICEALCVLRKNIPDVNYETVEFCANCDTEIEITAWETITNGFVLICPKCKARIRACSLCRDMNTTNHRCNWEVKHGKSTCWQDEH